MTELLKPALYRAEGADAVPEHPALLGGACACGYVFFPLLDLLTQIDRLAKVRRSQLASFVGGYLIMAKR